MDTSKLVTGGDEPRVPFLRWCPTSNRGVAMGRLGNRPVDNLSSYHRLLLPTALKYRAFPHLAITRLASLFQPTGHVVFHFFATHLLSGALVGLWVTIEGTM